MLSESSSNSFYISFVSPIGDESGWQIPAPLEEGSPSSGIRQIAEIGEDFFCVVNSYNDRNEYVCIPFSNIAYIIHDPVSSAD
jgi:hypothetical protein